MNRQKLLDAIQKVYKLDPRDFDKRGTQAIWSGLTDDQREKVSKYL